MKKTLLVVLVVVLLLTVACSSAPSATPAPTASPKPTASPSPTATAAPTASPKPTTSPSPSASVIKLTYNCYMTPDFLSVKNQKEFVAEVEKQTNGRVKFEFYDSGSLFNYAASIDALAKGSVDAGLVPEGTMTGVGLAAFVEQVPFLFDNYEVQLKYFNNGGREIADAAFQKWGTKFLYAIPIGFACGPFTTKKPVKTVEDFKGMKLRALSGIGSQLTQALGAAPTTIATEEVYQALQLGTVEGLTYTQPNSVWLRKWYEVSKYFTTIAFTSTYHASAITLKAWNNLPKDVQDIMLKVARQKEIELYQGTAKEDAAALQNLVEKGKMVRYDLPADEAKKWYAAAQPLWQAWAAKDELTAKALSVARQVTGK